MTKKTEGLARSIQSRLVTHAKKIGVDPNLILTRFAIERFLYRLSRSEHAERFVLKGALLLLVWLGDTLRPTRDADLLGLGNLSENALAKIFQSVRSVEVEADAMEFDPDSVRVRPIRMEDAYGGIRATLIGHLGSAKLRVQVDVGVGDAVTPDPYWLEYPSLLDLPRARLRAYRPETAIAEKVHAMVVLGLRNSRMRDFFDIYVLAQRQSYDGHTLYDAIRATFDRRGTPIPVGIPPALTREFAESPDKKTQWTAFLKKNGLQTAPGDLHEIVESLARFAKSSMTFLGPPSLA